jgi:regulatory protein
MPFLSDYQSGRTPPTDPDTPRPDSGPRRSATLSRPEGARAGGKKDRPKKASQAAALLQSMQRPTAATASAAAEPDSADTPARGRGSRRPGGRGQGQDRADRSGKERRAGKPIRDRNTPPVPTVSALDAVLRCLSRREHSQKELRDRLKRQGHAPEKIEEALERAVEMGYQSDERFARSLVRFKGARKGNRQLNQLLNQHRLPKEMVEEALEQGESELTRAVATMRRFEGKTPDPALRQKVTRFMVGRGFGFDVIKKAWKVVFEGVDPEEL